MKQQIVKVLILTLQELGFTEVTPEVEIPENEKNGEYTTNLAMRLAGKGKGKSLPAGKAGVKVKGKTKKENGGDTKNPLAGGSMEVALQVKGILDQWKKELSHSDQYHSTSQRNQTSTRNLPHNTAKNVLQDIERIEVAPPGFINFYLSEAKLGTELDRLLKQEKGGGTRRQPSVVSHQGVFRHPREGEDLSRIPDQVGDDRVKKRVMIEFTDPNPFKEFHIGHLYSNAVGESLSRLYEAIGWEVKRADYFGDVGMHVAKALWGIRKQLQTLNLKLENLEKRPLNERVKWMGEAYALGSQTFETDKEAAEEMKRLNKLIFIGVQELLTVKRGLAPVVDYRKGEVVDEVELSWIKTLFETGRQWSLDYFEMIYTRLGTKFDYYYPESEVADYGTRLVLENLGRVFEKSDSAIVYKGDEAKGLHTRVFINALGLPTYEAKELGLNWKKHQDYPADVSIIVTGKEINEYFNVLLAAMGEVIPDVARKTKHLGHGMVRLPEGKMSSRTGKIVTGESLIDTVKDRIYDYLSQSKAIYTKEEQTTISEKAAIASIKYSMLKVGLPSDITFDLEKSISFDGDSGPYLQYTYARARSVLRKAGANYSSSPSTPLRVNSSREAVLGKVFDSASLRSNNNLPSVKEYKYMTHDTLTHAAFFNPEEHALVRLLVQFPETVALAASNFAPSTLCSYLFQVAQAFNLFYAKHHILAGGEETSDISRQSSVRSEDRKPDASAGGLKTEDSFRLSLTAATAQVLKNGLYLLGIETTEKM